MKNTVTLTINGETKDYITVDSIKTNQPSKSNGNPIYMVRTYSAGVFFGELVSREGKEVVLHNAVRVWEWDGASSLSELAQKGTSKPNDCKFPMPVTEVILTEAIELIPVTDLALESLKKVKVWSQQ